MDAKWCDYPTSGNWSQVTALRLELPATVAPPPQPAAHPLKLYQAEKIYSHLAKHGPRDRSEGLDCCGFVRFEKDLLREFKPKCDILPPGEA